VQNYVTHGAIDCPITDPTERLLDTLMLGLRLAEGLSLKKLEAEFGARSHQQILTCVEPFQRQGWIDIDTSHQRLKLTDPEGFLFSNVILSQLFKALATDGS